MNLEKTNMKRKLFAGVGLLFSLFGVSTVCIGADLNLQEGLWETSIRLEVDGGLFPIPFKTTKCLSRDELIPNTIQEGKNCLIKDQKVTGNDVTWTISCIEESGALMEGNGKITYGGDRLEGSLRMLIVEKKHSRQASMTYRMKGVRKEACPQ